MEFCNASARYSALCILVQKAHTLTAGHVTQVLGVYSVSLQLPWALAKYLPKPFHNPTNKHGQPQSFTWGDQWRQGSL